MSFKKRLTIITTVYWVLLAYIIAALVWWFIALEQQNRTMLNHKRNELNRDDPAFVKKYDDLLAAKKRNTTQYISEGITFLALIILGAIFMYRSVRRQFAVQIQQENFMMAITHELKTPIAVAKLNLETLQKHQLDENKRQKVIAITLQETNRLNNLVTNILVSAQLESGRKNVKEELDFSQLVRTSVTEFSNRFQDHIWDTMIEDEIDLAGDPVLLQILVNNLLENAMKYSPPRTTITCLLYQENNYVFLEVKDEGPGIPHNEKSRVFEKFYRIGNEDTRSAKGTGLGLYLCRRIAEDHKATIRIADNYPKGSSFLIKFQNNPVK